MKNTSLRVVIAATLVAGGVVSIPAFAERAATAADHGASGQMAGKSTLSAADKNMLIQLAQANMAEVASSELAQTKSTNPDVLKFAKQMIEDHSKAMKEVDALAKEKNVTLPRETDAKHAAALKKMNTLSSAEFDKQYLAKTGVEDHNATLKLLQSIEKNASDADLKALAKKMKPTVESHLRMLGEGHAK